MPFRALRCWLGRSGLILGLIASGLTSPAWAAPFAYVTNFDAGSISVIDLATDTEVTTFSTGGDPYWIAMSANGAIVAATLHDSTGVAIIDATTNTLLRIVTGVGSEPEAVAVNSTGSTVYVADESGDALFAVDVGSGTVTTVVSNLANCSEPENMVISPDDAFLYITCAGSSVVRVATSNFAVTTIATGLNDPHGIILNASGTRLYYTDGTDVLEWDTTTSSLTGKVFAGCDMYNGTLSPDGARLYCVDEGSDLFVYATSDGTLLDLVSLGTCCVRGVAVSPDSSRVFVPGDNSDSVVVVDAAGLTSSIPVGGAFSGPRSIVIGPAPASGAGKLFVLPARITFFRPTIGSSPTQALEIENTGQGTLTGTVGTLATPFSVVGGGGAFSLAPGETKTVTIQFTATARGTARGGLVITSDDPTRPSARVQISGIVR